MLLLDNESSTLNSIRKVVVISESESVQSQVSQLLRSRGLENIEVIGKDFQNERVVLNAEETNGVIIDIKDSTNVGIIAEYVNAIIPQQVWCCLIGNSDSISLAQRLLEKNILYFHCDSQLSLMMESVISSTVSIPRTRNTINVCVLGCKGGIGTSFISTQIVNQIVNHKKVPVLLAQGSDGSQDLDLLFDKRLQGDIVEYGNNLDLFNGDIETLSVEEREKYNFIIYDQPIFNVHRDNFADFFSYSSSFILVVERHVSSLRVAKQFLEQCKREQSATGKPIRTFVCISDCKSEYASQMAKADIENLLGCQIDAVIPFLKKTTANKVFDLKLSKSNIKNLNKLTMKVIGVLSRQKTKESKSFFKAIIRNILGN
ncbi:MULTISPECIES: pilus assembly protein [Pasteurellaceae]|uniref:Pilus assembly protein n=1 Tax=Pasteurella atlantica TaxID=2827233 RepID=A0AAW8CQE6_9PAST|nr:pilus assembly protein [Pasteurella atlantica]MBR0573543.1 pilus assembly protein [Pasteurella atlantica]MDP8039598.1 pilus assembly protein [Pasteurella atlantica]MDP8041689.1 pilus assembly protein [Pasteurella atlantica]MDP8043824.1 pilus assembly protein [Pasteurella atlantica]MDP8045910.1 pilus assembly protein [Pasteurella atlantica]